MRVRRRGRSMTAPAGDAGGPRRPSCRTSSRPTTRRPTSSRWSPRRSATLPDARRAASRSSPSTTARAIATAEIADRLAAAHPDLVRVVHHATNRGYGAALRSGFGAARYDLMAFTDGDRQFQVADLGRLTARLARGRPSRTSSSAIRIRRADPLIRTIYARAYRLANRIFFGLRVDRRRLRLQALSP